MTHTSRTLKYLRDAGFIAEKVEQWIQYAGKRGCRRDLFHFADIMAMDGKQIIAVQSCGIAFSAHLKKILYDKDINSMATCWLRSGGGILLVSWRKVKVKRGEKKMVWKPRVKMFSLKDFEV